jgi:hypothetical protein
MTVCRIEIAKEHYLLKLNREADAEKKRLAALPPAAAEPPKYVYRKIGVPGASSSSESDSEESSGTSS